MNLAAIDSSATKGSSWLHHAAPRAKLAAFALVLSAVIVSWNVLVLAAIGLLLAAVIASTRVPGGLAFSLSMYPAIFAAVFAFSAAPDAITGAAIILKAVVAALTAVTLILTTPYPQVFAPLQKVMPTIVGDAMLMTYRSTFLLLGKFANLLTAVRLRSGLSNGQPVRSAKAITRALGGLLLYAIDLAQRDHDIMRLRGYEGRLQVTSLQGRSFHADIALVAAAFLLVSAAVAARAYADVFNPYSWIAPIASLVVLIVTAGLFRRVR